MSSALPVQRPLVAALGPGLPAPLAYARPLAVYMRALHRHAQRLLADGAPGPVHDFRVILRSLRSLLWAARGCLGGITYEHYRAEFRWISQRTAAVRDLDVLQTALPRYFAGGGLPAAEVETVLNARIAARRDRALADLRDSLRSARYRSLREDWRETLRTLREAAKELPAAATLADDLGHRVAQLHKRLRAYRRRSLTDPGVVHAFRKDCKRLRDLVVAFGSVWTPATRDQAVERCRRVLSRCGDYWDLQVHIGLLQTLLPPSPADGTRDWRDALTDAQQTRSTRAMHAIRMFQDDFDLPVMRDARRRARAIGTG